MQSISLKQIREFKKEMANEHPLVVGWGGGGIEKSSGTSMRVLMGFTDRRKTAKNLVDSRKN